MMISDLSGKILSCPLCGCGLRPKEGKDWRAGEKAGKGFFPRTFKYLFCDRCKRSWLISDE